MGMIPADAVLQASLLARTGVRHGFFTRLGGVSSGPYASLNCSMRSGDDPENLRENRRRVAEFLEVGPSSLLGVTQVHGCGVVRATVPWASGPEADALVTAVPELAIGVITADCGPVLFASRDGRVAGAAHAGWRGAAGGVLEATLEAMTELGVRAEDVLAVVGPCIGPASYEVSDDMRDEVLGLDGAAASFFADGKRAGHYQFDLPGYCAARLRRAGAGEIEVTGADTLADEARFFSHRRRTLAGGGQIGHQISAIAPAKTVPVKALS
ncbi:peptidoglycan editing factor PgeF [Acetobacter sp. AN02]|uniref:peptidoglycan editing factor PgeF n=1 Tax=Acetobacter sp. AN02 TaxID=2894186 RepID=UPI0024343ABB|nr:peptidoglycan editing factor PgeF [Acetobacter sp. AN02]MDG6094224.1 peptidoglycan editing factor PgeF [Acetobacter sp. AN02]